MLQLESKVTVFHHSITYLKKENDPYKRVCFFQQLKTCLYKFVYFLNKKYNLILKEKMRIQEEAEESNLMILTSRKWLIYYGIKLVFLCCVCLSTFHHPSIKKIRPQCVTKRNHCIVSVNMSASFDRMDE